MPPEKRTLLQQNNISFTYILLTQHNFMQDWNTN